MKLKNKLIATLAAVALIAGAARAQTGAPVAAGTGAPAVPPKRVFYYDAEGREVASADKAEHREELVYRDSIGGNLKIYYPSGALRRQVSYLHFGRGIKYGPEMSFYETAELKSRCPYKIEQAGPHEQFYRSGQLKFRHPFGLGPDGKTVPGQAFSPDGKPISYAEAHTEKMPSLRGSNGAGSSNAAIVEAVMRQVRYPAEALRAQVTGQVLVSFTVDNSGFVRNAHIVSSPGPYFNATVLNAVTGLGRFTPGESDGEPVDVSFTVPVNFKID